MRLQESPERLGGKGPPAGGDHQRGPDVVGVRRLLGELLGHRGRPQPAHEAQRAQLIEDVLLVAGSSRPGELALCWVTLHLAQPLGGEARSVGGGAAPVGRVVRLGLRPKQGRLPPALVLRVARPGQVPRGSRPPLCAEAQPGGRRRLKAVCGFEVGKDGRQLVCRGEERRGLAALLRGAAIRLGQRGGREHGALRVGAHRRCQRGGLAHGGRHRHALPDALVPVRVRPKKGPLGRAEHGLARRLLFFSGGGRRGVRDVLELAQQLLAPLPRPATPRVAHDRARVHLQLPVAEEGRGDPLEPSVIGDPLLPGLLVGCTTARPGGGLDLLLQVDNSDHVSQLAHPRLGQELVEELCVGREGFGASVLPRVKGPDLGGRQRGLHLLRVGLLLSRCTCLRQAEEEGHPRHGDAAEVAARLLLCRRFRPLGLSSLLRGASLLRLFVLVAVLVLVGILATAAVGLLYHVPDGLHRLLEDPRVFTGVHAVPPALAVLLHPQKVARAAHLQVRCREAPARAQLQALSERSEAFLCLGSELIEGWVHQVRAGLHESSADSATQLVQGGHAKLVHVQHDERVQVWDVDAILHERRGHEHIDRALRELVNRGTALREVPGVSRQVHRPGGVHLRRRAHMHIVSDALRLECTLQGVDLARGGQRRARGTHCSLLAPRAAW